jgi:hypothetical protein
MNMKRRKILFFPLVATLALAAPAAMALDVADLTDVTARWTFRYEVVSAFAPTVALIPKEENFRAIKVFQYYQGPTTNPLNERRVEVFYTGGDWMEFGYVYFIANSPNPRHEITADGAAAYFMKDLSTTDREEGAVAPVVNPLDDQALKSFIVTKFLDENGAVAPGFVPLHGD